MCTCLTNLKSFSIIKYGKAISYEVLTILILVVVTTCPYMMYDPIIVTNMCIDYTTNLVISQYKAAAAIDIFVQ